LAVEAGSYRVRASGDRLEGADDVRSGDRWRVQVWPSPVDEPRVLRWWPGWDPAGTEPQPTSGGRLLVGAEAEDARRGMYWLASSERHHLFVDDDERLWEHTNLADRVGTPQLEELSSARAEERYGPRAGWEQSSLDRSAREAIRALWRRR
jgi:hypothetical protein